jgi:hypothetical protein
VDRNEPEEDARQIAGEPLAELPAGILTPGIDRFRPSLYGRRSTMAATSKSLAQMNKTQDVGKATKTCSALTR